MSLDYEVYDLGDVALQRGGMIRACKLAYKSYGKLNANKDNVIIYPTWYSGQHYGNEWLIGEGKALDPANYFIIVPNMLGNGLSSSPSNTPEPYNGPRFPQITIYDNVRIQHRLITERFDIDHVRMVVGWSMGAMQAFQWGALYPDMVDLLAPFCGAAKCSRHNFVFLEGIKAALTADAVWNEGWYAEKPARGMRAAARVFAGWALSQSFYREQLDIKALGHSSLEDFLVAFWEGIILPSDANNLLAMLWTWQNADISDNEIYKGDFHASLRAIKAKTYVMPGQTDLYFTSDDSELEVASMPNAKCIPIPSIWGHFAGGPGLNPVDVAFLDMKLKDLLASKI